MIEALHRVRNSQSGVVLISAIILLVVGSILAASVLAMSVSESRQVQYQLDNAQAQAYARSAVRVGLKVIEGQLDKLQRLNEAVYEAQDYNSGGSEEDGGNWKLDDALFAVDQAVTNFETNVVAPESGGIRYLTLNELMPDQRISLIIWRENDVTARISAEITHEGMNGAAEARIDIERKDTVYEVLESVTPPTDPVPETPPTQEIVEGLVPLPYSFDRAAIAFNDFQMRNSVSISGTISYYGNKHGSDPSTIQHGEDKPDIIYQDSVELLAQLKNYTSNITNRGNLELNGSINNTQNGLYAKGTASGNIYVDTSAGDVVLYMSSLDVQGGTTFTVSGPNKFFILLADDGSGSVLNASNGLNILNADPTARRPLTYIIAARDASGTGNINIGGGDSTVQAYWYAPEHDININHDEGTIAKYSGAIVGNDVTLSRASMSFVASPTINLAVSEERVIEIPGQSGEPGGEPSHNYRTVSIPGYSSEYVITWLQ